MKRFISIFLILILYVAFCFSASAADTKPDSGQDLQQPTFNDIRYIPSFPDIFYDDSNKYILLQNKITGVYYLILSELELWHLSYYDRLMYYDNTDGQNLNRGALYKFDNSIAEKRWDKVQDLFNGRFSEYQLNMSPYYIISSNYIIHNGYTHSEDGVYYTPYQDWYSVTLALMNVQRYIKHTFGALVPIGVMALCSFLGVRLIRRILRPKIRTKPKNKSKVRLKKWAFKRLSK